MSETSPYRLCVAPMMEWTDRHCRVFHRLLAPHARLYTEMVTTGAVIHGHRQRLLDFDPREQPVALQLGGSGPEALAQAARIGEDWGYAEINLNVGCPSDRVQTGRFGACLMREPNLVAECIAAMRSAVALPVTVKCRIGVDEQDPLSALPEFVRLVSAAGARVFIVHARKAWLKGLSPRENRDVPPLDYELVYRLKSEHPDLTIVLNGGLTAVEAVTTALAAGVDGVMLGRAAYQDPWILRRLHIALSEEPHTEFHRAAIVAQYREYIAAMLAQGVPLHAMTRHILGLFNGLPGARVWRRILSELGPLPQAGLDVVDKAVEAVHTAQLSVAGRTAA
ncbi:MAG TPA: tRNA dihydrouridine(20/20a) synthase DusA [Alphaproteobacteria bacterium]|nr:tRNA dihydrouridine(20/20a) synthase DusA [Alphaproteobacteria bacterium]